MNVKTWIGRRLVWALSSLCLMAMSANLMAQSPDDLDVTMRMVIDDEDLSGRVVQELQLPEPAMNQSGGAERGSNGRARAEEAREQGRALGRQISEEARGKREDLPAGRRVDNTDRGLSDTEPDLDSGPDSRPETNPRPEAGQGR
ncbi:MAG: hypothetical protein KGY54_11635 [Oleiphilaceae bacterium]|nr:hypothetical protein [Oleiphilaceae bacterium]